MYSIRVLLLLIVIIISLGIHISMDNLEIQIQERNTIDGFINQNAATNLITFKHQAQKNP